MIISKEHGYLFIEAPHTGSTAIAVELQENYGGISILHKHANYREYQRKYGDNGDLYVFSAVRNPLDETVSVYQKYLNNHKENFTRNERLLEHGGFVTGRDLRIFRYVQRQDTDFNDFLIKFHRHPYTHHIDYNARYCDDIMRFQDLANEFNRVLQKIGIEPARRLPEKNVTECKKHFSEYYSPRGIRHAIKIFTPFMHTWNYDFPDGWADHGSCPLRSHLLYRLRKMVITYASKYYKYGPLRKVRAILKIGER